MTWRGPGWHRRTACQTINVKTFYFWFHNFLGWSFVGQNTTHMRAFDFEAELSWLSSIRFRGKFLDDPRKNEINHKTPLTNEWQRPTGARPSIDEQHKNRQIDIVTATSRTTYLYYIWGVDQPKRQLDNSPISIRCNLVSNLVCETFT